MFRFSEPIDRGIVEILLDKSAPERKADIRAIWQQYDPTFKIAQDGEGTHLNANYGRVQFDHKTLRLYWLLGFSGWCVLECYSPAVICSIGTGHAISTLLREDKGLPPAEQVFEDNLYTAQQLLRANSANDVPWPADVPEPLADRAGLTTNQDKAAFDLVCLATATAFCHEMRHLMLLQDKRTPPSRPDEEIACDAWAREYLTAKIGIYVQSSGDQFAKVLSKRSMGIALGVFILCEITPRSGHAGTDEYPPIADRMDAMLKNMSLPDNDHFWIFTASLLVAVLRRRSRTLSVVCPNAKELCHRLIEEIR